MPIYEVVLQQSYEQQLVINRWNYVGSGTPAAVSMSFALTAALGAIYDLTALPPAYPPNTLIQAIRGLQNDGVSFEQMTVQNVYSATDFYQTPFVPALLGSQAGESGSPTIALGYRTNRIRRDVARGTKRFVGLPEDAMTQGGVLNASYNGALNLLATRLSEVLEYDDEGNTLTFTPAVCGKQEYDPNPPPATGNHRAYRYFPTEVEQLEHTASGVVWEVYDTVRTQVSRQYGRGR